MSRLISLISFSGKTGRVHLLLVFVTASILNVLLKYLFEWFIWSVDDPVVPLKFLLSNSMSVVISTILITPFIVRRLNDISISRMLVIIVWIPNLFTPSTSMLYDLLWGFGIDDNIIVTFGVIKLCFVTLLLVIASNPKEELETEAKNAQFS